MNKKGFTLIELLVVVLIIGILGAIALPGYLFSVRKTQYIEMMLITNKILEAQERYFFANGTFSLDPANLDIELPNLALRKLANAAYWTIDDKMEVSFYSNNGITLMPFRIQTRNLGWQNQEFGQDSAKEVLYQIDISDGNPYSVLKRCYTNALNGAGPKLCAAVTGQAVKTQGSVQWYNF